MLSNSLSKKEDEMLKVNVRWVFCLFAIVACGLFVSCGVAPAKNLVSDSSFKQTTGKGDPWFAEGGAKISEGPTWSMGKSAFWETDNALRGSVRQLVTLPEKVNSVSVSFWHYTYLSYTDPDKLVKGCEKGHQLTTVSFRNYTGATELDDTYYILALYGKRADTGGKIFSKTVLFPNIPEKLLGKQVWLEVRFGFNMDDPNMPYPMKGCRCGFAIDNLNVTLR
jgi:hypothetical protein